MGVWPGEHEEGEGETENHEQCASLQLAGVEPGHNRTELVQLLH